MWILVAGGVVFLLPNTQQIMDRFEPALDYTAAGLSGRSRMVPLMAWSPSRGWALRIAVLAVASILSLSRPAEFLYFQF
jgi:hypothetical protein